MHRWLLVNRYHTAVKALEQARKEFEQRIKALEADVLKASDDLSLLDNGMDLEQIKIAEEILYVRGDIDKGADNLSCVVDAIQWFAQLDLGPYKNLARVAFGTKDYDRWHGQRCDCEYGYGPRHGHIIFQIGLKMDSRWLNRQERADALTDEERNACIYYLNNIVQIQKIHKDSKEGNA